MKKVDCTPSWGFVTQVILATLDANTNIKPKDRENIKGQLVDMSRVADAHVELMTKRERGGSNVEDEIKNFFLWYFRQNSDEAKGLAKELYDGLNAYMDEESLYKEEE
tara:strand:- start:152 stop:475 length:324 start_codon:yes stop_codon:yes gene_type:complete